MKEKIQPLFAYPTLCVFFAFIFGFTLIDYFIPDKTSSDLENKTLAQRPSFSLTALTNNELTTKYNEYVKDQVWGRDTWITLMSRMESVLLRKVENNGVLIGKDGMQFKRMYSLKPSEEKLMAQNTQAITDFAQKHPGQVTFLLAPSASNIYCDNVPALAPMLNENSLMDSIFSRIETAASTIDIRSVFSNHKDEYIYYRTDHHWTTDGAYLAYLMFCDENNLTPFDRSAHDVIQVNDFLGTTYSSSRYYNTNPDTIAYYALDNPLTVWRIAPDFSMVSDSVGGLYADDKFDQHDKYGAFLRGNNGYSTIEGSGSGSLLIIKDSYANCFVPFLVENYEKIGIIDLRSFNLSVDELMEREEYAQVLILYNFQSFVSDTKLVSLKR